jgi:hypothetical protein
VCGANDALWAAGLAMSLLVQVGFRVKALSSVCSPTFHLLLLVPADVISFVVRQNLGPAVCPGEWGGWMKPGSTDEVWQQAVASWFANNGINSSFYWCLNPNRCECSRCGCVLCAPFPLTVAVRSRATAIHICACMHTYLGCNAPTTQ